jgi:hypothetical protein
VQGQLRKESLSVSITTECAHCAQPLHIKIDSELDYQVAEKQANPFIFKPIVDFHKLKEPNIINAF